MALVLAVATILALALPRTLVHAQGDPGDYGDAPTSMTSLDADLTDTYAAAWNEVNSGVRLGALVDSEAANQPNATATGDDTAGQDDEDGVQFNPTLGITDYNVILANAENELVVNASTSGYLSVFIDYNNDGDFWDDYEMVFDDEPLSAGNNIVNFTPPITANHGVTYMRVRFSNTADNSDWPVDGSLTGETEDYQIRIALPSPVNCNDGLINGGFEEPGLDGDYNIYLAEEVPGWAVIPASPTLGDDFNGRHSIEIWSDGFLGVPAYEGSQFAEINANVPATMFQEIAAAPGTKLLWSVAHRGRDGVDVAEVRIGAPGATTTVATMSDGNDAWGVYQGTYTVPAGQKLTRFEFAAVSTSTGEAANGNLLDAIALTLPCDYGDAPVDLSSVDADLDPAYPTLFEDDGARHIFASTVKLGKRIDAEAYGLPTTEADGDDTRELADEDGVDFNPSLGVPGLNVVLAGASNTLSVTVSVNGFLSGWLDINQDGDFDDANEQIFNDQAVTAGQRNLTFSTSDTVPQGRSYMRFRFSTLSGVANSPVGQAEDGEVEDYAVEVSRATPVGCGSGLLNYDFELPVVGSAGQPDPLESGDPGSYGIYRAADVEGWAAYPVDPSAGNNFDERHSIELWDVGMGTPPYSGNQFAELNAFVEGIMYQQIVTTPGQSLSWSLAHRGREGVDTAVLRIGPPGETVDIQTMSDGADEWGFYSGIYVVPPGQYITRLELAAVSSASSISTGNFVDAVVLGGPCACPGDSGTFERTDILGRGMGSAYSARPLVALKVPKSNQVVSMYGQIVAKETVAWDGYARFTPSGGSRNHIEVRDVTSPAFRQNAEFWWGASLTPATTPLWKGSVLNGLNYPHQPRAFILYPTYETEEKRFNVSTVVTDSLRSSVYWYEGWFDTQEYVITLPTPLPFDNDITVKLALVDNDIDKRPIEVTVTSVSEENRNGVQPISITQAPTKPNKGPLLNILTFNLEDVPEGTSSIAVTVHSPYLVGDSGSVTGYSLNMLCDPPTE